MDTVELVERVDDRASFLDFAKAIAQEADNAQRLCCEEPDKYRYADPLGWAHLDVATFLYNAIEVFERRGDEPITWRAAAECIWTAKIYE